MMYKSILIWFLLLWTSGGWAQTFSPVGIEIEPFRTNDSQIEQKGRVSVALPVLVSGKDRLAVSPQYSYLSLSDAFPFGSNLFHQVDLRMGWRHQMNDRWNFIFLFDPALSSDFDPLSTDDLMWASGISFTHLMNARTSFSLGMFYAYRFSNNIIIPTVGFKWIVSDRLTFLGNIPFRIQLSYQAEPSLVTGFFFSAIQYVSGISRSPDYDYIWLHERNLGLFADRMMSKNWWFKLQIGYNLKCDLEAYQNLDEARWQFGAKLTNTGLMPAYKYSENGFFLNISLTYRFAGSKTSEAF